MNNLGQQGQQTLDIPLDSSSTLEVEFCMPAGARRIVLFACHCEAEQIQHRTLARVFQKAGFATLVFDLCNTPQAALSQRLIAVSEWVGHNPRTKHLEQAFFGGKTIAQIARSAVQKNPPAGHRGSGEFG